MNQNIIRLAAAWALSDPDFQAVVAKVLKVEIFEVYEASESLDDLVETVERADDLFNGIEPEEEDEHPEFDGHPEDSYNVDAAAKRDYWETFDYDYFGDDDR